TSMWDVLMRPAGLSGEPPFDVLRISPSFLGIIIRHQSTTGLDDTITRPAPDAVPLFWRFMSEKFGIG
ncbi:MAG: hypothetical protein JWR83_1009, partial [Aeromicrobium sp.]|nr:hypothetical protein [Aeromicrobium sp.]